MGKKTAGNLSGNALRNYVETHILPHVETPAQYAGNELNQIVKEHAAVKVRIALGMPETYALGMSALGIVVFIMGWMLQQGSRPPQ